MAAKVILLLLAVAVGCQATGCPPGSVGRGHYKSNGRLQVYISATNEKADSRDVNTCCPAGYRALNIDSADKDNSIRTIINDGYGGVAFWTSGMRFARSRFWYWRVFNAGGSISYSYSDPSIQRWNKYAHEPDMPTDGEACIALAQTGWFDTRCGRLSQVICEKY